MGVGYRRHKQEFFPPRFDDQFFASRSSVTLMPLTGLPWASVNRMDRCHSTNFKNQHIQPLVQRDVWHHVLVCDPVSRHETIVKLLSVQIRLCLVVAAYLTPQPAPIDFRTDVAETA